MACISVPTALLAGAAISGGASAISGVAGAKAAKSAADTQAQAAQIAADAQLAMFAKTQANLSPWLSAGGNALSSLQALTGTGAPFGSPSLSIPTGTTALTPTTPAVAGASQPQSYTPQQILALLSSLGTASAAPTAPVSSRIGTNLGGVEIPQVPSAPSRPPAPTSDGRVVYDRNGAPVFADGSQVHDSKIEQHGKLIVPAPPFGGGASASTMSPQASGETREQMIARGASQAELAGYAPGGRDSGVDENGNGTENIDDPTGASRASVFNPLTDYPGWQGDAATQASAAAALGAGSDATVGVPLARNGTATSLDVNGALNVGNGINLASMLSNPLGWSAGKITDYLTSKFLPSTAQGTKDELGYAGASLATLNPAGILPGVMGILESLGLAKGDSSQISWGGEGGGGGGAPSSAVNGSGVVPRNTLPTSGSFTAPGGGALESGMSGGGAGGGATGLSPQQISFLQQLGVNLGGAGSSTGAGDNLIVPGSNAAGGFAPGVSPSNPLNSYLTSPYRPMPDFAPDIATLEKTPGYQFVLDQGLKSVKSASAAQGLARSGAQGKALAQYAEGLAGTTYQQQFTNALTQYQQQFGDYWTNNNNIYAMLSGISSQGQNAAAGIGSAGTAATQAASNFATSGAAAKAAGTVGSTGAITGALGNIGATASDTALWMSLLKANPGLFGG